MPGGIERIVCEDSLTCVSTIQLGRVLTHHVVFRDFLGFATGTLTHPIQLLVRGLLLLVIRKRIHQEPFAEFDPGFKLMFVLRVIHFCTTYDVES